MTLPGADAPVVHSRYALGDPADQGVTFMRDPMHFPFPVSPLFQSVHAPAFSTGFSQAAKELHLPVIDFQVRYRNNYHYERPVFVEPASEDEGRRIGQVAEASLQSELPRMEQRWNTEHLPRLLEILDRLKRIASAPPEQCAGPETVDEINDLCAELWTIHFRIVDVSLVSLQLFDELFAELFGEDADPHALVSGVFTQSISAGIGLSDLAMTARSLGIADVLAERQPGLLDRLHETESGRDFVRRFDAYLEEYGLRQDLIDLITPTWRENPQLVINAIQGYLSNGRDNRAEHQERIDQAAAATDDARNALITYPEPVRQQFEALLGFARIGSYVKEEHNFYIDQQGLALIRLAFLRIGQDLVASGQIDAADDVFMLTTNEIRDALAASLTSLQAVVSERRESFVAAQTDTPPPFIGVPPSGPPPDNPITRALMRFSGGPPQESGDPDVLKGMAGSRGSVTAPAFVARTLEEATGIPPGHILVAVTTTPPWTPLFGIASAVVTETGGPLSHSAIVAREYGVPAVVGAHLATEKIATGQMVTVDGTSGLVHLKP